MTTADQQKLLDRIEENLVDWKRRAKAYQQQNIDVPDHVTRQIDNLKQDARLLRAQMETTK